MKSIKFFFSNLIVFIPILIVVSLFCAMIFHFYQMYALIPRENIKESIGTVLGFQKIRNGELAKVHFKHEEQVYSVLISDVYVLGEKFMVEYEQDNPKANCVRLDKPIFLKDEEVSFAVGYLNTYNTNCFKSLSCYTYYVDGNKYEKFFTPLENSELKYPNAKEGYNYIVKYWNINPQRSIIVLDKKTNKSLYDIK